MNKELKDFSVLEIKALIYDESVIMNRASNNIRLLEEELVKRKNSPAKDIEKENVE